MHMAYRYLLYIDILGFSDLVAAGSPKVHDLYEVVASLNVHRHSAFRAIVFSDTVLVYNTVGGDTKVDRETIVMFLCEFSQDLQHRLTKRGIFFRAVLVRGEFTHYELNSIPCFFGPALIEAHRAEKEIQAIGLFIAKSIVEDCDIFKTASFNKDFDFVFITQSLEEAEHLYGGGYPMDRVFIEGTEFIDHLVPEVMYLQELHANMQNQPDKRVRTKYARSWELFKEKYPKTLQVLEANSFDGQALCPGAGWATIESRYPQNYSWAITERVEHQ